MNLRVPINISLKHCILAAKLCFLLLITSANSYGYTHPRGLANKTSALRRDEPDLRIFFIAVTDTQDDSIGDRCKADLKEMTKACHDISEWLIADKTEYKIISGNKYSKAAVTDAITNWLPGKHLTQNDIVIFYYSGHGFRRQYDTSQYPRMWLKTKSDRDVDNNNLRIEEDIYQPILKLGAGMSIVLSDCCNNTFGADNANYDNVVVTPRPRETHKRERPREEEDDGNDENDDNGDRLFITDHPVSILATAAGKGELAGGKSDDGGFFTMNLLDALYACIYYKDMKPSWKAIFDHTDEETGLLARSAECPMANHNANGRCVQTLTVKMTGVDE